MKKTILSRLAAVNLKLRIMFFQFAPACQVPYSHERSFQRSPGCFAMPSGAQTYKSSAMGAYRYAPTCVLIYVPTNKETTNLTMALLATAAKVSRK